MSNQINIKEATELTGRSEKTIRRLVKSGQVTAQKERGVKGEIWLIDRNSLLKACPVYRQEDAQDQTKDRQHGQPEQSIIDLLQQQLSDKDKQLFEKDRLIQDLSQKLDEMIQRVREANILLKNQQEQKLLEQSKSDSKKGIIGWIKDMF